MPETITIRRLGPEDAHLLERVMEGTFDGPVISAQLRSFLESESHEIVVGIEAGQVVGMATGMVYYQPDKPRQFWLMELGVADARLRRGIGTRLMTEMLAVARSRGCVNVALGTETDNAPARGLYRSLGAREIEGLVLYEWDFPGPGPASEDDDVTPGGA